MVGVQKRKIRWTISLLLVMLYFYGMPAQAQYGGGTGEPNDPFLIYTDEQMNAIGTEPNDWDKHFKLMADIDLSGFTGTDFNIIGYFVDCGSADNKPFTGVFNGNGKKITNFSYTCTDVNSIALFSYVEGKNAQIKHLGLIDPNIDAGKGSGVAPLVDYLSEGIISGCYADGGSVSGNQWVGGLVGSCNGIITNCYATCSVSGNEDVGGLVGSNDSTITNCYSVGAVSGWTSVGGLVGDNVSTDNEVGGGIISCYSSGHVSGNVYVGGLVGSNRPLFLEWSGGRIINSYSVGAVTGTKCVGGLVGRNIISGTIISCYSTGSVSGSEWVGGLVGVGSSLRVSNSFWDIETSGLSESNGGGTGKTTAEMQTSATFLNAGWDFVDETENGIEDIWWILEGQDYPRLWWEKYGGGTGKPNDPYLIYTAEQMNAIGAESNDWDKHFKLMADIDLSGYTGTDFSIIGTDYDNPFIGVLDGHGHTISNFSYISTATEYRVYIGLFGYVGTWGKEAVIKDLGLIEPNIDAGKGNYVGSLVGWLSDGTITGCYVEGGIVSGDWRVGGLVGNNRRGRITNCYSTASVTGRENVGGLVGSNGGSITISYSTSPVCGSGWRVGGLVGNGNPDRVANSFWDTQTSGQATSDGGTGLTTADMQTTSTFLESGWDFVDETENGTEDIWWIIEGQDYPRLKKLPEGPRLWPYLAFCPEPQNGAIDVIRSPVLYWAPANPTMQHDIYLGEGKQAVANATTLSLGIYRGRQPGDVTSYDPGILEWGKTYYWRIDEYNTDEAIGKGHVWSFTTANFIVVDDFESYNDLDPDDPKSNRIWNTWIDGYDIPTNGSLVGYFGWWGWNMIVHSGEQSMPFSYDNSVGYSEATANVDNLEIDRDWTIEGVVVLSLWFRGDSDNVAETLYVALNGTAIVTHDNPNAAQIEEWTEWTIDLQAFADKGVNLANVNSITLGSGNRTNPVAGGSGHMWFDDIRLYRPRHFLAFSPDPRHGAADVIQPVILRWYPAEPTLQHDIYFGEDEQVVANATTESPGIYRGRQAVEMTTYDPGILKLAKTYYWRIDEVNEADPDSPWKGNVWSFTTANFLTVDDFESYNDVDPNDPPLFYVPESARILNVWSDGYYDPTNGSLVGYSVTFWWLLGVPAAHSGNQSMPLFYDNSVGYSEVTANVDNLEIDRDWTIEGAGVLSLWFYGDPDNPPEPMYVALANANGPTAVVYHDDTKATQITTWTEWRIDLQAFANQGVNLTNINTVTIGFGDRNNPQPGGWGKMYFDDIRLYRPVPPELEPESAQKK